MQTCVVDMKERLVDLYQILVTKLNSSAHFDVKNVIPQFTLY